MPQTPGFLPEFQAGMVKIRLLILCRPILSERRELPLDPSTSAYQLLALTALSGECSPDAVSRLGIRPSYGEKLLTKLKEEGYIKTHYRDRLRGYRLTNKGKSSCSQTTRSGSLFIWAATQTRTAREAIIPGGSGSSRHPLSTPCSYMQA